jgi:hypothetical protein
MQEFVNQEIFNMNIWLLLLTLLNVILLAGLSFSLFLRIKEKKEDQRLTKGLQLLQNKISILEDLSDRTDEQVHKLVHVIDHKANEVRHQLQIADEKIDQIEIALSKALDISKVFNEQVPHQEMIDRQKTNTYVQAAKMAHQGFSIEQISAKVDLSPAEIEMITKVNKENLQFSEESLPAWINESTTQKSVKNQDTDLENFAQALNEQNKKIQQTVKETAFDSIKQDLVAQNNLRSEFNKTVAPAPTKKVPQTFVEKTVTANGSSNEKTIKPMEFRKIISHRN